VVTAVLQSLLALFKAIPVLKQAWDELIVAYTASQYANMKAENAAAIRKAIYEYDQRDLEKLLDPNRAGLPSGIDGVLPADSIPIAGVPDSGKSPSSNLD
jgi:hypothetical protein